MGLALVLAYIGLNLLSPADIFPALAPYRPMLILAMVSVPPLVFARVSTPEIGKLRTQFILVILFFGYACGSWLPHGGFGANVRTLIELSPNVIAYFMGVVFLRSPFRLQLLRATLVLVAVFVIFNALSELPSVRATGDSAAYVLSGHGSESSDEPRSPEAARGPNEARIRGLGMLNDPNNFGQYLLMVLPLLFVGNRKEDGLGPGYFLAIPIAVLFLVGVYFTGSRGAAVGLAVLIGLFLTRRFKAAGAVVSAVAASLLLLAINAINASRTISMSGGMDRLAIWSEGMHFFKTSPVVGIGAGGYMERNFMTAHNSYLLCAAELGMVGYFLWMSMVVVTLIQLTRVPKVVGASNPVLGRWAVALRLSLSVYMFTSFFLSRTYDLPLFLLLGMSGGIIIAAGGDQAIPLKGTKWAAWSMGLCVSILASIYVMLRLRVV